MIDVTDRLTDIENDDSEFEVKVFAQSAFEGGMVTAIDPLKLGDNQYYLLKNGRVRFGNVMPVKKPLDRTAEAPSGKFQGLYATGDSIVIVTNGSAYIRDYTKEGIFFNFVSGFNPMDQYVDRIFGVLVPESYNNLTRTAENANSPVLLTSLADGNPSALVLQDGLNRPNIILATGNAKQAGSFDNWSYGNNTREYVPVGKQMLFKDGILYVVSPDGRELYRSVTGRPLDFVVAVDENGEKLLNLEIGKEEASRLSHKVSFDPLIALYALNVPPSNELLRGAFLASTQTFSWLVIPNYTDPRYGEPTFINVELFPTGAVNQFCITNVLGDTVFVDNAGLKSFNAISQFNTDGANSPFSKSIHSLFKGLYQTTPSAFVHDNYALFGVKTIYGDGILVYDEMQESFVSLDIFDNVVGNIIQYAEIKVAGNRRLFFITDANKFYEAYASDEVAKCEIYPKEWASDDTEIEQIPKRINLSFINVKSPGGTVEVTEYVDRKAGDLRVKNIVGGTVQEENITNIPFGDSTTETTETMTFKLQDAKRGYKVGVKIAFDFEAELNLIEIRSKLYPTKSPKRQQVRTHNSF